MIHIESLAKTFGPVKALQPITFTLNEAEHLGISGPSGCGKTTLLRLIAGLETPSAGRILIDDRVVSSPEVVTPPHTRGIGFVFQEGALWPHLTVMENVMFGLATPKGKKASSMVTHLLEAMQLTGLTERRPRELSAGQARRVSLARALAPQPRFLLMDEPLTNLDAALKDELLALIRDMAKAAGSSMIYVTHDRSEISTIADRELQITNDQESLQTT